MILRTARREYVDLGPAPGRCQGHGGEALGSRYVLTAVQTAQQRRHAYPKERAPRQLARCGQPLEDGPCDRTQGHTKRDGHRSRAWMDRDNRRRRQR